MMYSRIALLICFLPTLTYSFGEDMYARLLLGSHILKDAQRICTTGKNDQEYEALFATISKAPVPAPVRILDSLLSESTEARIARVWRDAGALLNSILQGLIYSSAYGAAAWSDSSVQAKLTSSYPPEECSEFNRLMGKLVLIHAALETKIKMQGSWWPTRKYIQFKDTQNELEPLLREALQTLIELRLRMSKMVLSSLAEQSPFKLFVPTLLAVMKGLTSQYEALEFVHIPPFQRKYEELRFNALYSYMRRCMPFSAAVEVLR